MTEPDENGVRLDRFADPEMPSDEPVIGTVANVNPVKGLETLIGAAARLREASHVPYVVVVGAIPERQRGYHRRLEALASQLGVGLLHFIGARRDVRPALKRLDFYVSCSVGESSPVSVWEAMALARPVVSTDVGDVARHVRDGEAGSIVPVGDDEAMAARIGWLLDHPEARTRMGAAAREAAQDFRPEEIARLTLGIYDRVRDVRLPKGARPEGLESKTGG